MNTSSKEGTALICIPDISGFTRFMVENNTEFSKKIIPSLLRTIINSNKINLSVGEIEGDAVVFYRFGVMPTLMEIIEQCKLFYINFNSKLKDLMSEFADDFQKNASTNRLSLKIVVHAAEISSTHIEGIPKLIGEDVVVIHKLLKNSIEEPEYILLTDKLLINYSKEEIAEVFNWDKLIKGKDKYEFIGLINYSYITLNPVSDNKDTKATAKK